MAKVVMSPVGIARIRALSDEQRAVITLDVARTARRLCPVDEGDLRDSIKAYPELGRVEVGTDHWAPTEYGSRPHMIRSTGKWPLRNRETGETFGREVRHPGTPEQSFMRRALYQRRRLKAT